MRLQDPVPEALLNAYVDGALDPQTAAALAERALAEPALAARIARLHGLKAGVAGLVAALPPAPPLPSGPLRDPKRRIRAVRMLIGAATAGGALAAGLTATAFLLPLQPSPDPASAALSAITEIDLAARHDAWARTSGGNAPQAPGWLTDAMATAGLNLVHAAPLADDSGTHLAFIGRNDCRISLFERPGPGRVGPPEHLGTDGLMRAEWHSGQSGFTLIARDMNPQRFETIAMALAAASTRRDAPAPALLAALSAARQPCHG